MVAKPTPPPVEQARILRALADRLERKGESLPAEVLEAIERVTDDGARMWNTLSPEEQSVVEELAATDLDDIRSAGGE